ncbi:LOW QUALITY PROTEIN: transcription initiation factor TFIID subunit 13 [Balaenoptera ricei]|uniref:LOW QUALITY PROTEIN: transcription initiation factor TFIID subunit 13 n=1 Tax=Balaenoptera ricei TaxID=2746895 RepID=UPI0028BECEE3|nr:LOW QUALITY PROTEIN: transcription initiation factor TFIID subunit 13 [Balaenoptera ricei]
MADEEEDPTFEEENEEIGGGAEGGQGKRKRLFSKELRCMMYGFGDDQNPYTESVDILEDLVIEFITEMTHKAMSIGRQGRVQVEDIVFLIRKDPRKFARVKDLLTMNEELKRARKAFDEALWILTPFVLSEASLFSGETIFNNYIFHSKVLISSHVNER